MVTELNIEFIPDAIASILYERLHCSGIFNASMLIYYYLFILKFIIMIGLIFIPLGTLRCWGRLSKQMFPNNTGHVGVLWMLPSALRYLR